MSAKKKKLSARERLEWLRLLRSENVGPITLYKLLERFGSAAVALKALPDLAKRVGAKRIKIVSLSAAFQKLDKIESAGVTLVTRMEENYPPLLAQVEDAPPLLPTAWTLSIPKRIKLYMRPSLTRVLYYQRCHWARSRRHGILPAGTGSSPG